MDFQFLEQKLSRRPHLLEAFVHHLRRILCIHYKLPDCEML